MLVQNDSLKYDNKDGESQPIQASVEIKHYPKERSARSTRHPNIFRSSERPRQKSLNTMLCGCLVTGTECTSNVEHPPIDNNRRLLPTSAIQSMESLSISRKMGSNFSVQLPEAPDNSIVKLQPVVNLPSCALITDALLSQTKRSSTVKETTSSNGLKHHGWRSFRFSRKKERTVAKTKHCDSAHRTTVTRSQKSDTYSETEQKSDTDQSVVFSPLPSQALPETISAEGHQTALLGPQSEADKSKKCFVIDLDETLVHSSFKVIEHADFKVGVEIDGVTHRVYVLKRPHVDLFLSTMANLYECVLFTASLAKYADPVADFIDKWQAFRYRLFRESCVYHRGNYVKDLSHLGRPINQVVILDNSPASYMFHASHAVQISSWFDDVNDRVLLDLIPYFEKLATQPNVVDFLKNNVPPTPYAAIGTVGLPPGFFPHTTLPAGTSIGSGKSIDGSSIISNIKRPTVASPFPVSAVSNRSPTEKETPTTSTVPTSLESKTQHVISSDEVPLIAKLGPASSGPSLIPVTKKQDVSVFPVPLSLATYSPVSSPSLNVLACTKVHPSDSVQTHVSVSSTNVSNSCENTQLQVSEASDISPVSSTSQPYYIPSVDSSEQNSLVGQISSSSYHQKKQSHSNKRFATVPNRFKSSPNTSSVDGNHRASSEKTMKTIGPLGNSLSLSPVPSTSSVTSDCTSTISYSVK
ncbi:unnamed protein product [Heterobilharzia americana]|nr:unnamed protein product [Heterobilharzia americana]CAH8471917.1 unnamed protein product [Heterobilharzia americana]